MITEQQDLLKLVTLMSRKLRRKLLSLVPLPVLLLPRAIDRRHLGDNVGQYSIYSINT